MKILLIHSDYLEFEAKQKTKIAEDTDVLKGKMDECLTAFIAVEKEDEENPENVINNTVNEIIKTAENLKVNNIVVYPYAHLSSDLSSPKVAKDVLKGIEEDLKEKNYNVLRAPFGWYKAFKISCKGHPLSELSRKITAEMEEKEEEKGEKKEVEKSKFYLLNGETKELIELNEKNVKKLEDEGFEIIDDVEDIDKFVNRINEILKENPLYPDTFGFERMKESFEMIGCDCDYVIAKKRNIMVGVCMYFDKNRKNPKFIEVVGVLLLP